VGAPVTGIEVGVAVGESDVKTNTEVGLGVGAAVGVVGVRSAIDVESA